MLPMRCIELKCPCKTRPQRTPSYCSIHDLIIIQYTPSLKHFVCHIYCVAFSPHQSVRIHETHTISVALQVYLLAQFVPQDSIRQLARLGHFLTAWTLSDQVLSSTQLCAIAAFSSF